MPGAGPLFLRENPRAQLDIATAIQHNKKNY